MTRWARSGNTQKHKKMPGDATPWKEFTENGKINPKNNTFLKGTKIKAGPIEKKKQMNKSFSIYKFKNPSTSNVSRRNVNKYNLNKKEDGLLDKTEQTEKMVGDFKFHSDERAVAGKEVPMKELQKEMQGMVTPLSLKVNRKMCELRKELQEGGLPEELIKDIIRKQRRTEKHKLRKYFRSKPCFNCRQMGHLLADCPFMNSKCNNVTGICFKCGSTEHKSLKCTKNIEGYPLAKCFICEAHGHISKDCPKNNHGIYPDGGKCSLCGNINHLRKDCPSLTKKKEQVVISAHTINEGKSIDDEIIKVDTKIKKKISKQPKIVKF